MMTSASVAVSRQRVYEMIFDEPYMRIAGGSVTAYSGTGALMHVQHFNSDLFYECL